MEINELHPNIRKKLAELGIRTSQELEDLLTGPHENFQRIFEAIKSDPDCIGEMALNNLGINYENPFPSLMSIR